MSASPRFCLFSSALAITIAAAGTTVVASGCEPSPNEPPPQTPKAARAPDKTEVTMEVSSAAPPGEKTPASSAAPTGPGAPGSTATPAGTGAGAPDLSEDPIVGGVQSDPIVEKAVAPLRPRLRACYRKALAANPNIAAGSATFDATVGSKDGHVASARFVKRDGLDEDMVGCLLVAVKAMNFDPSRKSQVVTLTFGKPSTAGADAGAKP